MNVAEEVGKALARTTQNLSELMAKNMKDIAKDTASQVADYRNDAIPKMNEEVAVHSIDETMFKTKEVQVLVIELKQRLSHSPNNVSDWFTDSLGDLFGGFYDIIIGVVAPSEIGDFKDAKNAAGYLTSVAVDVVVLVAILDLVATACSLTLVRNIARIGALFMSTFGIDRYITAVIAPAMTAGLIPQLNYGFNEQYQAMIPGPTDLVRFQLREVWDPSRRQELLEEGTSGEYNTYMSKQGYNKDMRDNYWAAHWVLPSVGELNEMLHRGIIDEATWDRFVKYNDFDPTVRPWLKGISYNPYTRVDSQRMWSLDLLTEDELKANYKALGYDEIHAQRMTLWTKINVLATELRARYAKGWITPEQVKQELIAEGMPAASVDRWVQRIVKAETAARTDAERTLTKAEIIKGYTKEVIDYPTALQMLIDMGYTSDEAEYILIVNTAVIKELPAAEPKSLTKTEIIKGYKLNIITQESAIMQLVELGYTPQDANYLLIIGVPADTTTGG
jgi:hypothetical protein